ncbi:hypothetical protein St703_22320 [Sporolactobacillus terrae]|uniref:Uncharacterized protein n=1 Tax=Sporolactobacillus terrae TaxID=269673 RepID=A0A5K7WYR7_9BACL|nr:hypothetical protein St703_22320 [Sporolactobacillus terrae]
MRVKNERASDSGKFAVKSYEWTPSLNYLMITVMFITYLEEVNDVTVGRSAFI